MEFGHIFFSIAKPLNNTLELQLPSPIHNQDETLTQLNQLNRELDIIEESVTSTPFDDTTIVGDTTIRG